jgi:hypothetical protein
MRETVRRVWIVIGIAVIIGGAIQILRLRPDASVGAFASLFLLVTFGGVVVVSALNAKRSGLARIALLVCFVATSLYAAAYAASVGREFGTAWLIVAVAAFAMGCVSILVWGFGKVPEHHDG